jgi:hypothetical protein
MRHDRHYTVEQADAVRPWVAQRVQWIRSAHARLVALGERASDAISQLDPNAGGAYPGRDVAPSLVELSQAFAQLDAVDVVLRDIDRGLVDFPAIRDGEEVYLCWLLDEEEIGFWHNPEDGFAGRRPL